MRIDEAAGSHHDEQLREEKREQCEAGNQQDVPAAPDWIFAGFGDTRYRLKLRRRKRIGDQSLRIAVQRPWLKLRIVG